MLFQSDLRRIQRVGKRRTYRAPVGGALIFLALVACDKGKDATPPQPPAIEEQATQKVREDFERTWLKQGDSWFGIYTKGLGAYVIEAKGISFKPYLTPMGISQADRLNGIEWTGTVEVDASVHRKKRLDGADTWQEWEKGLPGIPMPYSLQKKNGEWTIQTAEPLSDRPPLPEELGIAEKDLSPQQITAMAERRAEERRKNEKQRNMLDEASTLVIGTWRFADPKGGAGSTSEYHRDGTISCKFDDGFTQTCKWRFEGDTLVYTIIEQNGKRLREPVVYRMKLLELNDTQFVYQQGSRIVKGTRVK